MAGMTLSFHRMTAEDLDEVVRVDQSAFTHPWSRQLYEEALASNHCWVVHNEQKVHIGQGVLKVAADEAELLTIAIDPSWQGRGAGFALLDHLMRQALELNVVECFLEVRESNHKAYELYERYGFNEAGRRRGYYPAASGREDALVMVCSLGF